MSPGQFSSSFSNNSSGFKSYCSSIQLTNILNLTKNSSLAAAIAYPDIVLVFAGTAMMQTGRAIEIVSITMLTYLSLSIAISIFMNWYNKKIAIKEK